MNPMAGGVSLFICCEDVSTPSIQMSGFERCFDVSLTSGKIFKLLSAAGSGRFDFLVVMITTPFTPFAPYCATAALFLSTDTDFISSGEIEFKGQFSGI